VEVEACVIGGGVGGLAAARRLASLGVDVLVVEGRVVAGGASGRNGGFLLAGAAAFHVDARERFGRDVARRLYARTLEAQEEVYALAGDAVRRVGSLRLAMDEREGEHVRALVAALHEDGFPGELVEGDELPERLRRPGRVGCRTGNDGALHPVRWIRRLARAAEEAGARIVEGTPVAAPLEADVLKTPRATIRARHVIVAADGALPSLVPAYTGRVRPRRLHMLATEPLPDLGLPGPVYLRYGYEYFQQVPDGALLAGGFSDLDGETSYTDREEGDPRIWARLERYLDEELGIRASISHRWVGVVGYSDDGRPYVGAVPGHPGLYVLGGYSGTGNLVGYVAGQAVADLIATGHSPDVALFPTDR
jgi:gamma-glutamylputrescine oxidase